MTRPIIVAAEDKGADEQHKQEQEHQTRHRYHAAAAGEGRIALEGGQLPK
jgi:hypothetical protein